MQEEGEPDEAQPPTDLSVPIWVWVILGFAMVMAVVIVMIVWAGGGGPPPPVSEQEQEVVEDEATEEPATMPATAPG